jgi:hypothetical protein
VAVESHLVARLRAVAALLDDAALAALSSKGLVRRARKDAAERPPHVVGEHEGRVRVAVEEWTVDVAERPAESVCGCPAHGVCRHILVALIHLGEGPAPPGGATPPCGAEIVGTSDEEIRRWAGAALVKRALGELATGMSLAYEDGAPLVARNGTWNVECRWIPGGGLAGMLCSCHAAGPCVHKVVAVLGWQGRQGTRDIARETTVLAESSGAPRTREEVRLAVAQALYEVVGLGLCRLSSASQARFETLATSAHGVDLPRLERLLRGLADEIGGWLRRDSQASSGGILARAAQAAALSTALQALQPSLVGRHRSRYERVGELELVGMGARAWRTRSGYAGLTVYLWERRSGRWNTWTDARPVGTPGFSALARYTAPGPWGGCESPAAAATRRFRLTGAWRNSAGRLSGRESMRMVEIGMPGPDDGNAISSWSALVPIAWQAFGTGLAEPNDLVQVVLLEPKAWAGSTYDQVLQELRVGVVDRDGRALLLALSHTDENQRAIETLEAAVRNHPPLILGILHLRHGALAVEPISLVDGTRVVSLGLDGLQTPPPPARADALWEAEEPEGEEGEAAEEDATLGQGPLADLLAAATSELESLAEGGSAAYRGWPRLRALLETAEALGMTVVAAPLRHLLDGANNEAGADRLRTMARGCLQATYVVRLAGATAAVEAATEVYGGSSAQSPAP